MLLVCSPLQRTSLQEASTNKLFHQTDVKKENAHNLEKERVDFSLFNSNQLLLCAITMYLYVRLDDPKK